jgi:glycogen synthase
VALHPAADDIAVRFARGAADAILLGDDHDRIGRAAALALLYGTLPIAPDVGANRDYLVDYDASSRTGHAVLYETADAFEIESAVRRALALRSDGDVWSQLVQTLFDAAPRWAATARAMTEIAQTFG